MYFYGFLLPYYPYQINYVDLGDPHNLQGALAMQKPAQPWNMRPCFVTRMQENHNIQPDNTAFETVAKFK
jgi:hypothetical protein